MESVNAQLNNKRIAKNTLLLYFRMLFLLAISLFTSRVIFKELGASDFGLYNVIAGFVVMLSFLNGAMGNATQRFLAFELVRNDIVALQNVFCQIQLLHLVISFAILLLGETLGLWFVNSILNIPPDRIFAANIVYQCSLLSTLFTIISVPYNSIIIARENMKLFSMMGLLEGGMKIIVCLMLFLTSKDKLIIYAICLALASVLLRLAYWWYCRRYEETRFRYSIDWSKLKEVGEFAGWSLCGSISTLANMQGINVLINLFFSTIVNAARGIAYQIDGIIRNFVANFQTAMNPQIVKSFSVGDLSKMHSFIYLGSKISFFILYVLSIPIIFNLPFLLQLWLGEYPQETVVFTRLVLANSLIVSLSGVLSISVQATGKIRNYQLTMGFFLLLNLPIAAVLFMFKFPAYSALLVSIVIESILLFLRLLFLQKIVFLNISHYLKNVLCPVGLTIIISFPICYWYYANYSEETFYSFLISSFLYCVVALLFVFLTGLDMDEKGKIIKIMKNKYFNLIYRYGEK